MGTAAAKQNAACALLSLSGIEENAGLASFLSSSQRRGCGAPSCSGAFREVPPIPGPSRRARRLRFVVPMASAVDSPVNSSEFAKRIERIWLISQLSQGAEKWISKFSSEHNHGGLNENWIDEFSKLNVTDEWTEEFSGGFGESSANPWADDSRQCSARSAPCDAPSCSRIKDQRRLEALGS